jgi:hypothetical protein
MATEEKKAYYATRGVTKDTMIVAYTDPETLESLERTMTDQEFDEYLDMCSEPEEMEARDAHWAGFDPQDPSTNPDKWKIDRISAYPKTDPQLDAIFHALKAIKDSGIDLGEAGNAYVEEIQAIKEANPKPE